MFIANNSIEEIPRLQLGMTKIEVIIKTLWQKENTIFMFI